MTKPIFLPEEFGCHCPADYQKPDGQGRHYEWCEADDTAFIANSKLDKMRAEGQLILIPGSELTLLQAKLAQAKEALELANKLYADNKQRTEVIRTALKELEERE